MESRYVRLGFQAGLVAGAAAGLVMLVARVVLGVTTIPELVADELTILIPPTVFAVILDNLLFFAKPLLIGTIVVAQLLICGAIGALYARALDPLRSPDPSERWSLALALSGLIWVLTVVGLYPLVGAGFLGASLSVGAATASATILVAAVVFAYSLASIVDWTPVAAVAAGEGVSLRRRAVLRTLGWGAVVVTAGAFVVRGGSLVAANAAAALSARQPVGKLPPAVTPNSDFYTVSKNLADPVVDESTWTLQITGLVGKPITLSYQQLTSLPAVEQYTTLECISNVVGGNLISNAKWRGVPFRSLLAMASPKPGVRKVKLTGADGYEDSVTFDRAMNDENLLAWEMNGDKLPTAHGFPARLLVPGIYGMKNVKWLTKIELIDYDFQGYWQVRGWSDQAHVKEMSRIDLPSENETLTAGPVEVGGIAFSGDRGISKVELSVDGGKTWKQAILKQALGPYTWVLWTYDWAAPVGKQSLLVRAVDRSGRLQNPALADTLPGGASGYDSIVVNVVPPQQPGG